MFRGLCLNQINLMSGCLLHVFMVFHREENISVLYLFCENQTRKIIPLNFGEIKLSG